MNLMENRRYICFIIIHYYDYDYKPGRLANLNTLTTLGPWLGGLQYSVLLILGIIR